MNLLQLIDSLVQNCGKKFHLEICSRTFENELLRLIQTKTTPYPIVQYAKQLLKKWAKEFRPDPQLNLIPALYDRLRKEGVEFIQEPEKRATNNTAALANPDAVSSKQEEDDIAKAIELSLKEAERKTGGKKVNGTSSQKKSSVNTVSSLYDLNMLDQISRQTDEAGAKQNGTNANFKEPLKARALYDFEAAEDNELTFKAGELILILDSSDVNWWKGSNHRGEGLFPANFVSTDLNAEPEPVCELCFDFVLIEFIEFFVTQTSHPIGK